jgi:hypothetical protein
MTIEARGWPELSMPDAEADCLRQAYRGARTILEYGSGGSTVFAAEQRGKMVFSVESDREWALGLQQKIDDADLASETILYHVDIGATGRWGRPKDDRSWRHFHRYPTSIWAEPFFRMPDVILIDGRLRPACLVYSCLKADQPVTILFDDYATRPMYHVVEVLVKPECMVGRMAVFKISPQEWPSWTEDLFLELCALVSFEADEVDYSQIPTFPFLDALKAN